MKRDQVFKSVAELLSKFQTASGIHAEVIEGTTRPIGGLDGFDSHAGLEFTCAVEQVLKISVPLEENLCVNDKERRATSVDEIVDRVLALQKGD